MQATGSCPSSARQLVLAGCSSSSTPSSSGGSSGDDDDTVDSGKTTPTTDAGHDTGTTTPTEDAGHDSGNTSGKAGLGETCAAPADCESNFCFVGGQGSYCSLQCTTANAATVCVPPVFDGTCNKQGYCRKPT